MNYTFTDGIHTINLGANSSDSMSAIGDVSHPVKSNKKRLNQIGALFLPVGSSSTSLTRAKHVANALRNAGYGNRANVDIPVGSKLYLITNEPEPPYIKVDGGETAIVWNLYTNQGALVGALLSLVSGGGAYFQMLAGKLYDDGTFDGNTGGVRPHKLADIIFSNKVFEWFCNKRDTNLQMINPTVAEYLKDFAPIEPDGEFVSEGVGDFDSSSDNIDLPDLPTLSAIDTRMLRVYRMTSENLSKFNKFLWSDLFDVNTFKKLFTDPMQAVLNLNISPINVDVLGLSEIKLGNINTGVQCEMC